MTFSLDTSMLIQCWRDTYPIDVVPSFWDALEGLMHSGEVLVSADVHKELSRQDDPLLAWIEERGYCIRESDEDIQQHVPDILAVEINEHNPPLVDPNKPDSDGDVWVIALARAISGTVVTGEDSAPNAKKKAKIPDVCDALGVPWTNAIGFMRNAGIRI